MIKIICVGKVAILKTNKIKVIKYTKNDFLGLCKIL